MEGCYPILNCSCAFLSRESNILQNPSCVLNVTVLVLHCKYILQTNDVVYNSNKVIFIPYVIHSSMAAFVKLVLGYLIILAPMKENSWYLLIYQAKP